ncbi:MAG TPA: hypothetical protein VFJ09_10705 [Nocardioidaceae bacterium]|nr:hypothetical protein [Nocardioidaceae bacterium]
MSSRSRAGAACLVVGPFLALVSRFISRSESHQLVDQAAAFTAHPAAEQLGLGLDTLAAVVLVGGLSWLTWATHERSPRLAFAGAVVGVLGLSSVVCDDSVHLAGARVAQGHSATQAAALISPLYSGAVVVVGPLSVLTAIGLVLLAVAAARVGAPRWAVAVTCGGLLAESAGCGSDSRYLAAAGFALSALGFAGMLRLMLSPVAVPEPGLAAPARLNHRPVGRWTGDGRCSARQLGELH